MTARVEPPAFGEAGSGCHSCRYWAEDDDGDDRGCCVILFNDTNARGWRTLPNHLCVQWSWSGLQEASDD